MRADVGDDEAHDPARRRADRERRQTAARKTAARLGSAPGLQVHAGTSAAMLAVKVIARLQPAREIGMSMASVSSPSSGSWNAIERKVASVRKPGVVRLNSSTTAARSASRPAVSLWSRPASAPGWPPWLARRSWRAPRRTCRPAQLQVGGRDRHEDHGADDHVEGVGRDAQRG